MIWIALLFAATPVLAFQMAYTNSNKMCASTCVYLPSYNYHYCYLGWGKNNGDQCVPAGGHSQVPTLRSVNNQQCTSLCADYDDNGLPWCFTGVGGAWDTCITDPLPLSSMQNAYRKLRNSGDTQCYNAPHMRRFRRNLPCKDDVQNNGINQCIAALRRDLPSNVVTTQRSDVNPIYEYQVMSAPPIRGLMDNVPLPLYIRANITPANRVVRDPIPSWVNSRMTHMNAVQGDERGHLLAASLGGPTHDYNFVPQSAIANRNAYGWSWWFRVENEIRQYLDTHNNSRVLWDLVVTYGDLTANRRPTGFGLSLQYLDSNNQTVQNSGTMYFSNDPNGGCPI